VVSSLQQANISQKLLDYFWVFTLEIVSLFSLERVLDWARLSMGFDEE
jgi:hypothetical protein